MTDSPPPETRRSEADGKNKTPSMDLVAVGASAGGLEPLQEFFGALDPNVAENVAFVVIQHLSPDYKSMMGELLERTTKMPIATVEDGMFIKPGHVYLIPPAFNIFLRDARTFGITRKPSGVINLPIDIFITSATEFYNERIVAVILSGTGSDGVRGVVEVNAAGGLSLCQSPESAQFDGMPRSAIATGFIDDMGTPTFLAERVLSHLNRDDALPARSDAEGGERADLSDILRELNLRTGIPFEEYKRSTVARRVERRMALNHSPSFTHYLQMLRTSDEELETLRREMLIGVTSFFRDREAFDDLKHAIDGIIERKEHGDAVRIWVAGCATGEEAYSIAMLAEESLREAGKVLEIKVFATDLEQTYLDVAGAGIYPEAITSEVSPARIKRFFQKTGDQLRVRPELRRSVIFARHNMINDAPFTKLDLVTCRNTLIYFGNDLQERVLRRFQYALGTDGVLFLGSSETLGSLQRDFAALSSASKIYKVLRPSVLSLDALQTHAERMGSNVKKPKQELGSPIERARQVLMERVAPPSLLLSPAREILHVFGDVARFLKLPLGEATLDAARMMEPTAASALHALLKSASTERDVNSPLQSQPLKLTTEDRFFRLVLTPVRDFNGQPGLRLLSFVEVELASGREVETVSEGASDAKMELLQSELALTRQNLQNTIEELEASNEELQATNEELLASNEELQSTNEELQSVNEELYTVNSEYQEKIRILDRVNEDLDAMARATGIPTLFLDDQIHIVRFTPSINDIYTLRESDIGRELTEFSNKIGFDSLPEVARSVLESQETREVQHGSESGSNLLIRIVPYSESGYGSKALVIMFIDVSKVDNH